jgi:hypothetical protein
MMKYLSTRYRSNSRNLSDNIRNGCVAAFSVDTDVTEELVVVELTNKM